MKFVFFAVFMVGMFFIISMIPYSRMIAFHAGAIPISWGILTMAIFAVGFLKYTKV